MKHPSVLIALLLLSSAHVLGRLPPPRAQSPATAAPPAVAVPFSSFTASVETEPGEFEVRGTFELAEASDGINLFREEVSIRVGEFSVTLAPGSFKPDAETRGKVGFKGPAGGLSLDVLFRVLGPNKFSVKIEGEGLKKAPKLRPEDVELRIGDDGGRAAPAVR